MSNRDIEFSLEWLEKSRHALHAVDKLAEDENGPGDIIAFHCQQAIEKSIKGLLTAHSIVFPRTHDLADLIDLTIPILPSLGEWRDDCIRISRYAVEIRYPDTDWELNPDTLKSTRETAWEIFIAIEASIRSLQ